MKRIIMLAAACAVALPVYAQNHAAAPKKAPSHAAAPVKKSAEAPASDSAQNAATVNGKPITQKSVDNFAKLLVAKGGTDSPQLRAQLKEELINRQIFVQAAEKQGLAAQDLIKTEIDLSRQAILANALMNDYLVKHPVTDAQVQAQYNQIKQQQDGKQEYDVSHILVKDEKTANDLLAEIKADPSKFADLAKKNSQDPGSAGNGGDLGWAPPSNYVPPFADAVSKLKKGELADKPVKTDYGWHIIKVNDTRAVQIPALDQVKPQIEEALRRQALAQYQKSLRDAAKVQQ